MISNISTYAIPGLKYREPLPPMNGVPDSKQMIEKIKSAVCQFYCLDHSKVFSKSRKREYVYARQVMQKLVKDNTRLSLKNIGEQIHNGSPMDHTSVIHSIQTVNELISIDKMLWDDFNEIQSIIYS